MTKEPTPNIIEDFEEVINNFQDYGKINGNIFKQLERKKKVQSVILFILTLLAAVCSVYKILVFPVFIILLLATLFYCLKCRRSYIQDYGIDCRNMKEACNKFTQLRDDILYKKLIPKGYDSDKMEALKNYVLLKIKEDKRKWGLPRIATIGIVAAIGYSFLQTYLDRLSGDNLSIAFKLFLVFSILIIWGEIMIQVVSLTITKKDKHNQLVAALEAATIRYNFEKA